MPTFHDRRIDWCRPLRGLRGRVVYRRTGQSGMWCPYKLRWPRTRATTSLRHEWLQLANAEPGGTSSSASSSLAPCCCSPSRPWANSPSCTRSMEPSTCMPSALSIQHGRSPLAFPSRCGPADRLTHHAGALPWDGSIPSVGLSSSHSRSPPPVSPSSSGETTSISESGSPCF